MSRLPTGTRSIRFFRRSAGLAVLLAAAQLPAVTQRSGSLDAEFTRLPFAQWAAEGKKSGIHWTIEVAPAQLSTHQRLMLRVTIVVDGRELAKRMGKGEFVALVQLEDSDHRVWQEHTALGLESVRKGVAGSDVQISHFAFVLPGDYTLSLAICDTHTLEHSFATQRVHVGVLKGDPLPHSWVGLPEIEFVDAGLDTPDIWYLPDIASRLNLPVATKRPVQVELLVNMTPSERARGSLTAMRRNLSLVIPALKILSGMKVDQGSLDVAMLDLTQRRVAWEQRDLRQLDWDGLRKVLREDQPGKIDVHALEGQSQMRQFFLGEIRHRLEAPGEAARVVVVLSGSAFFQNQDPVEAGLVAVNPNRRLIYIRDRLIFAQGRGRGNQFAMPPDDLEQALRPLNPRVYDSESAGQFRQILAEVLQQIASM